MTNMKIQYASDLHLEFADNWRYLKAHPLEVTGDILRLAGDIGYLGDDNYSKHPFWDWASENYKEVHCCMGNACTQAAADRRTHCEEQGAGKVVEADYRQPAEDGGIPQRTVG